MCIDRTKNFLRDFGVGDTYRGYRYCIYSVKLAVEDPGRLDCVTKYIYYDVAEKFRTSVGCVERDIRTVAEVVWRHGGKEFFYRTTGELFVKRPANAKFLEMLVHYITSEESAKGSCQDCKEWIMRLEEDIRRLEKDIKRLEDRFERG